MSARTTRTSRAAAGTVVALAAYKEARRAALFMRGAFHDPPWLHDITVEVAEDGKVNIVVLLTTTDPMVARCIATSVNGVRVVRRVVG